MDDVPIGKLLAEAPPEQYLAIERDTGRDNQFRQIDQTLGRTIEAALTGLAVAIVTPGRVDKSTGDLITIDTIDEHDRPTVDRVFGLKAQQARGAWFLPETATIKAGVLNLPAYLRTRPPHALTIAADDVARVHLASSADVVLTWSLAAPFFETLLAPITERASGSAAPRNQQEARWLQIMSSYEQLGLNARTLLEPFTYRGGWGYLDRGRQAQYRIALLDALASYDPTTLATRFRIARVQLLAASTLKKTKSSAPLARQVLTKALQPTLAAFFGGDWLAFLDWLGEQPNPNERLVTALPEPKLYVGSPGQTATVAEQHGLTSDDVDAMLSAFLGQDQAVSPVHERVNALSRWWTQFDAIHSHQRPGMPTLWGLVEEGAGWTGFNPAPGPVEDHYRNLMSADVVHEIDRLWDGFTLARWPETIVSEPFPHRLMAETLGPAVKFWHGIALTAWYVCEGPYSRTSLDRLTSYHAVDLAALSTAGTPVHPSLFDELNHANQYQLGLPQPALGSTHVLHRPDGLTMTIQTTAGERRDGFEIVRDIITRHRQGWTRTYFPTYLDLRWRAELTTVFREHQRALAVRGKAPTFRQFAKTAAAAANHWFNGNLASLYTAIGEVAPATPRRVDMLPGSARGFVQSVYHLLGGEDYDPKRHEPNNNNTGRFYQIGRLADSSLRFIQLSEALGHTPDATAFHAERFEWEWAGGQDVGWQLYTSAIERARKFD